MPSELNSILSSAGSILSGIVRFASWLLAVQGLLLGLMVLFYGRRSFWVFASVFGFVLGLSLATNFGAGLPAWAQPLLAVVLGGLGAAVAFRAPRPIAAFIGGVLLAALGFALASAFGVATWLRWVIAVAAGVLGFYLFWRLLDWALIVGTSLIGAGLASLSLTSLFGFTRLLGVLPFVLLLVAGVVYQRRDQRLSASLKRALAKSKLAQPDPAPTAVLPAPAEAAPAAGAAAVAGELVAPAADEDLSAQAPSTLDPAA